MAKTIIKGFVSIDNINVVNRRESIDKYLGLFSQYFESIGNCMVDVQTENYNNTALFYSKVMKLTTCGLCRGGCLELPNVWNFSKSDAVWEHIHLNQESPIFMNVEASEFTHRLCDQSMVLTIRDSNYNKVVGEFCPHKKILLGTDWTNDETKMEFASAILIRMEENGLITKRTVTKVRPKIMLGADPELELVDGDTNEIIHCKNAGIRDRVLIGNTEEGRIGHDGMGAQRELRPEPAPTPEGLVGNIEKLITQGLDEVWSLEGNKYPLGGHIHLGGVTESFEFGKLLDYYLGPLCCLNGRARLESSYGKIGSKDNIRKQPHGIEFRTPPAGWLSSKELAMITLIIVKMAAEKHYFGEDIVLSNNLGDDLISLGLTSEQMKLFFTEIEKFKTNGVPKDMKVAWGYKTPPKFVLEFRDGWAENVKVYIEDLMKKIAIEENLGGRCIFYGLGEERGNVFSVVMSNMQDIDMPDDYGFMPPLKSGVGKNYVGMPYSVRNNLTEAKKMTGTIVSIIKRTINPPVRRTMRVGVVDESQSIPTMTEFADVSIPTMTFSRRPSVTQL
jgi:hypothetical protein